MTFGSGGGLYRIRASSAELPTCYDTMRLTVLKVDAVTVHSSDSNSYDLAESNKVDHIGTVKGCSNVILRAIISPDNPETRAVIDWQGAIEDAADPLKATVSRTNSVRHDVNVRASGIVCRQAKVWVVWLNYDDFNNTGPQASDSDTSPTDGGVAFGATNGTFNGMQLRATISPAGFNAVSNVIYNHKRTKEANSWSKESGLWSAIPNKYSPPGTDDDLYEDLEDNTPSSLNHIYDVDTPGLQIEFINIWEEAVRKWSFVNFVYIKLGTSPWIKCSDDYLWHSIVWLEYVGDNWQRKAGSPNEILPGAITVGNGSSP